MAKAKHIGRIICGTDYAKRINTHIAIALVVYTLLLIFIAMPALDSGASIIPFFMLVVLVMAIIPYFRSLDRRWQAYMNDNRVFDGLQSRFTKDRVKLWAATLAIPLGLTLFCKISSFSV